MITTAQHEHRIGVLAALGAYLAWGLMPIYFKFIDTVNAFEIIAHRVVWGLPVLLLFMLLRDGRKLWSRLAITKRQFAWLLLSAALISGNWLIFVWAVVNDRVLASSLGYFINPLMNVLFGFLFLGERLSLAQKWAVGIAAAGTAYLAWFLGSPPWISLALAVTFASYGLVRKRLGIGPMLGLFWEYVLVTGPALAFIFWQQAHGRLQFGAGTASLDWLLVFAGLITVVPLIWFNTAVRRLSLTTIGFLQYLAPSMTFLLAVFLWQEPFTRGHAVAFTCIWIALALVSMGPLHRRFRVQPLD